MEEQRMTVGGQGEATSDEGGHGPVLKVERPEPGVVLLTLNLPDRRNAMTTELTEAWSQEVAALAADRSVRVVVVTGAGSAFCAGGDLSWLAEGEPADVTPDRLRAKMLPFYRTWLSVRDLEVPVIAAVNGPAIGAGLCLALAADLRYAAPRARFGAPFAALGMHPGMAGTYLLPEAVGLPLAREMLYTGRLLSADEAAAAGLINGVVTEDLLSTVLATAGKVAGMAPIPIRLTKAALRHGPRSYVEALEWEAIAQPVTMASADLREGLTAQAERRPPVFRGI
jgi:enoyl-CoA hydratase/carnithine racemase